MTTVKRTEDEAVRKEQILTAARTVFREKGYDATAVSDIVREAGVAQGTFYLYFPSKKHAVLELAHQVTAEVLHRVKLEWKEDLTFEERLRGFISTVFEIGREKPDLCRLVHLEAEAAGLDISQTEEAQWTIGHMAAMFQGAMDKGEMMVMDPMLVMRILKGTLMNAIHEAFVFGDGSDGDRIEKTVTQMMVNALVVRR